MRQFVTDRPLSADGTIVVDDGAKYHYLTNVLRLKVGDMVYARLPDNSLQGMTVTCIDSSSRKMTMQAAGEIKDSVNKAAPIKESVHAKIYLFQFIAKPSKMELIVRQATECGVEKIMPVSGEFCQKGFVESARKQVLSAGSRWDKIIIEAREQSGSPVDTEVLKCSSINEAKSFWESEKAKYNETRAITLYEQTKNTKKLHEILENAQNIDAVAIAVGAEGGISPSEVDSLFESGFIPVHFNTNILRCETASLYGISAVQTLLETYGAK